VERLNATGAKDPIDVVIGRWTSWTEQVERNSFIGNNKLLGAEMLGYSVDQLSRGGRSAEMISDGCTNANRKVLVQGVGDHLLPTAQAWRLRRSGPPIAAPAAPGSAQRLELVVSDIDAAREELIRRGVEVSELFHRDESGLAPGPEPQRRSYRTYASFSDPDGNSWLLQEVKERVPGRVWDD
jgi:hypothetical protein